MFQAQQTDRLETSFHFLGDHCEIRAIFKDKTANSPVTVLNPKFEILKDGTNQVDNVRFLVPLSPSGASIGEYRTSFLSEGMTVGDYTFKLSGYYPDTSTEENKIEISSQCQIFEMDSLQAYINSLRVRLHDHLPQLYLIDDPEKFKWNDSDLYEALKSSVNLWNAIPPISRGNNLVTIETMPFVGLMIDGAEFYALNQKEILEIWNTVNYQDETSFQIDRSGKIHSKADMMLRNWMDLLKLTKKDWMWRLSAKPLGIKSTKIPIRALMQLSFVPNLSFLSNGF